MLPWRDENNRVMYFDASYLLPWGMFGELIQELAPVNMRKLLEGNIEYKGCNLATRNIPAATIVAAWISAEIGVGPSIASGNHT